MSDRRLDLRRAILGIGLTGGTGWLVIWSLITLIFDVVLVCGIVWQIAVTRYQPVAGAIAQSKVEGCDSTRPDLHYTYTVNGVNYTGDRYRCWTVASNDGSAERIVAAHPVGTPVTVYYDPDDPAASVLRTGIEGSDLYLAIFLTPFNIIMLGGWWRAAKVFRRLRSSAPFGGLPLVREDERLQIRLDDTRFGCPAGLALALSFILIFALGLTFGFNPPLPLMVGVWAALLGLCALVYWCDPLTGVARKLVLDDRCGKLEVYRRSRAVADLVIAATSVKDVTVVVTEKPDAEGGVYRSYAPTIVFTQADGSDGNQPLRQGSDKELADALVAGIRDWLRAFVEDQPARSDGIQTASTSSQQVTDRAPRFHVYPSLKR
jgi:hypothetical protein